MLTHETRTTAIVGRRRHQSVVKAINKLVTWAYFLGYLDLLFPYSSLDRLQLLCRHSFASREVAFVSVGVSIYPTQCQHSVFGLTRRDLGIDFDSGVCRYQLFREFNSFVDRNPKLVSVLLLLSSIVHDLPLANNCVMFHAAEKVSCRFYTSNDATHLLMLSILSIFLIPSQCRMSGIKA